MYLSESNNSLINGTMDSTIGGSVSDAASMKAMPFFTLHATRTLNSC